MSEFCVVVCKCVKCVYLVLLGCMYYGDPMSGIALCVGASLPWFMGSSRSCSMLVSRSHRSIFEEEIQGKAKLKLIVNKFSGYFVYHQF